MKKTLKLDAPLLINGKKREEFEYDAMEITSEQFLDACQRASSMDQSKTVSMKIKENDYALHFYIGCAAIIACNPEISFEDFEQMKGYDTLKVSDIGFLFMLRKSGEPSKENNSDAQLGNTAEPSTPAQEKSEEQD